MLVDSRIIMLGAHLAKPEDVDDSPIDTLDGIYNETSNGYQALANLAGFTQMEDILSLFADKLVGNLMASAESQTPEHMRIVDLSLEILSSYLDNTTACRLLASLPVVKQLATAHITQFRILQGKK